MIYARFRTFAIAVAVVTSIAYCIVLYADWPLFVFGPATGGFTFFNHPPSKGPTLDWYGMVVSALLVGVLGGFIACLLPERLGQRLTPALSWIFPVIALIIIFYLDAAGY